MNRLNRNRIGTDLFKEREYVGGGGGLTSIGDQHYFYEVGGGLQVLLVFSKVLIKSW